jgi:acyl carrier protein
VARPSEREQGVVQATGDIEIDIRAFLSKNFPLYKEELVERDQSLVESGVIDSLGILELVDFDELLPENLDSIANITRYLGEKLDGVVRDEARSS